MSLLGRQRKIFMADVSGCTYKRVSGRQPRRRGRMLSIARRTIASNGIQPPGQLSADDSFGRQSDGADRAGACAVAAVEFAQARASGCAVRTIAFPLPPARGGRSRRRRGDRAVPVHLAPGREDRDCPRGAVGCRRSLGCLCLQAEVSRARGHRRESAAGSWKQACDSSTGRARLSRNVAAGLVGSAVAAGTLVPDRKIDAAGLGAVGFRRPRVAPPG